MLLAPYPKLGSHQARQQFQCGNYAFRIFLQSHPFRPAMRYFLWKPLEDGAFGILLSTLQELVQTHQLESGGNQETMVFTIKYRFPSNFSHHPILFRGFGISVRKEAVLGLVTVCKWWWLLQLTTFFKSGSQGKQYWPYHIAGIRKRPGLLRTAADQL